MNNEKKETSFIKQTIKIIFYGIFLFNFISIFLAKDSNSLNLSIISLSFYGFIFWFIFRKKSLRLEDLLNENKNEEDIAKINSEKHGCKCYMEGLSESEREIANIISEGLSYKDYFIFNNLIIPSEYNVSSQIDHLIISKFGVFVIESKDFNGWIFGRRDDKIWTQSFNNEDKYKFQNPIHQNYSHVMSIKKILPFIHENFFKSIIVFSNRAEIKTPRIDNVLYPQELIQYIKKFNDVKLSENNIQMVLGRLSYMCQTVDISSKQHVENLRGHHSK